MYIPDSNGRTEFEVPVVCDGKMLKNGDLKTRLNKMSAKEVGAIFPFELVGKELKKSGENEVCVYNIISDGGHKQCPKVTIGSMILS